MHRKMREIITVAIRKTPAGEVLLGSLGDKLCLCDWNLPQRRKLIDCRLRRCLNAYLLPGSSPVIEAAAAQLEEYFAATRHGFNIPVVFAGTEFQKRVWQALMEIPYGTTTTYAQIARVAGNPQAVRAAASAIGANALSIIVPCHRVIGTDGRLTGYAGGITAKQLLLDLELNHL